RVRPHEIPMTPLRRLARLRCLALAWCCAVFATACAAGADPPKTTFRLPEGDAAVTLRQFSQQARTPIVYPIDLVRGVKTHPVQGEFTAREALDRMVAGTELIVSQDASTGALTVGRPAPSLTSRTTTPAAPPPENPSPSPSMTSSPTAKSTSLLSRAAAWLALSAAAALDAQTTPATAPRPDDTLVLTPFVVDATQDRGFVAASSLAGGRLASDLRDTPAAYSVLTAEFLDAVGVTNLIDATKWTVNNDQNADFGVNAAFGGEVNIILRGVSAGTQRANFFPVRWDFDTYNIERLDFGRGPNSILFGAGGLGGFANSMTKQARTDKAFAELRATYGSFENRRASLDVNRPLGDKFAVRLNLLWQDRNTWRDREFDRRQAAHLTLAWKPTRTTTLRVESETGVVYKNQAFTSLMDLFSGWDGVTTFDAPLTATPANNNALGVTRNAGAFYVYQPANPGLGIVNFQNTAATQGANGNPAVPVNGRLVVGASGGFYSPILGSVGLPFVFQQAINGSHYRTPSRRFTVAPTSGNGSNAARYQVYTFTANHQLGEHLFLEAAANYVPVKRKSDVTGNRGLFNILLDINRNLPTGAPNPNYLQPYSESNTFYNDVTTNSRNYRLGAAAVFDRTRFGDFRLNALVGSENTTSQAEVSTLALRLNPDLRQGYLQNNLRYRYYWNSANQPQPRLGPTATIINPVTGTTSNVPVDHLTQSPGNNQTSATFNFAQVAGTAKLFKQRVVILGAIRRDEFDQKTRNGVNYGDYAADWNGLGLAWRPAAPADWSSLKFIPKDANGVATGPLQPADTRPRNADQSRAAQYAGDRFRNDYSNPRVEGQVTTASIGTILHAARWFSPYVNYAETFTPQAGNITIDGQTIAPNTSTGWDYGLRFSLADSKLNVSLGRYQSKQVGSATGTGTGNGFPVAVPQTINVIQAANVVGDQSVSGVNARNFEPVFTAFADTRDIQADGYELEITANPAKNWRLSLNYSLPNAYQLNAYPTLRKFFATNDALLRGILKDAGVLIDSSGVASVDQSIPTGTRSPDAGSAANAWNSLQAAQASIVAGPQRLTRSGKYNANVFTDYTISSGLLKNVRLGGGVNFRGPQIIANRGPDTIVSPTNPLASIDDPTVGATDYIYGPSYRLVTATLGYSFKLAQRYPVRLDFGVSNVFNEDKFVYYNATVRIKNGDLNSPARVNTPYLYTYLTPRTYNFTASVRY
ncbi:MAG: hypothetical protein RLZZ15_1944, partial [Verrucomicrobiota bacterium]